MKVKIKRLWKLMLEEFALFTAELVIVSLIGALAIYAFIKLSFLVLSHEIESFDQYTSSKIFALASPGFTTFMKGITFTGNFEFVSWLVLAVCTYFLFIKPHRWFRITVPVVAIGSISLNILLKNFFERPRPALDQIVHAGGHSFPSGHAMFSFSFYGLLIYVIWNHGSISKPLKWFLTVMLSLQIFFIGVSRVYLKVHFVSDVIAGFAAGFIWLTTSVFILRLIENYITKKEHGSLHTTKISGN